MKYRQLQNKLRRLKELRTHCFSKRVLFSNFFFILRAISIGIDRKNYLKIFETSRLNARGTFGRSETVYVKMDEWPCST